MEQQDFLFLNKCKVCNSKNIKILFESNDFFLTKEKFFVFECKNCGFRFTNPQPLSSDLYKYYKSEEYISHNSSKKGILPFLYRIVRRISIKRKFKIISSKYEPGKILDYGCGEGEFLKFCKQKKWNVKGIEPNENARIIATDKNNLDVDDIGALEAMNERQFDVITLWHVLEHISDFDNVIFNLKRLLKDNGMLIIALPNFNSWDARYYGKYWAAYDLPRHLWHFSHVNLGNIMRSDEFKLIQKLPLSFDSYFISILSEKYRNKKNYVKSFLIGFISNIKAKNPRYGYSSQIYLFKKIGS